MLWYRVLRWQSLFHMCVYVHIFHCYFFLIFLCSVRLKCPVEHVCPVVNTLNQTKAASGPGWVAGDAKWTIPPCFLPGLGLSCFYLPSNCSLLQSSDASDSLFLWIEWCHYFNLQVDSDQELQGSCQGNTRQHVWFPKHCDGIEKMLQPLLLDQTPWRQRAREWAGGSPGAWPPCSKLSPQALQCP